MEKIKKQHISLEGRRAISLAHKGKILSEEHKKKLIASNTGRKHTEDYKKKMSKLYSGNGNPMSGKRSPMKGKHHSNETIKKISIALIGKVRPRGKNCPNYGRKNKKNRCKWFNVQGIKCQGGLEKKFVEACIKWGIPVKRNRHRIHLKDNIGEFSYCPDFIIFGKQLIEVKGWLGPKALRKYNAVKKIKIPIKFMFKNDIEFLGYNGYIERGKNS